jgi:hypothetical protein
MTPSPATGTTIHEAFPTTDTTGAVRRGNSLTQAEAIAHRRSGGDVVVCGADTRSNCNEACVIESAVGPCYHDGPHRLIAGPLALPHWQQRTPPPAGHSFYETSLVKAIP